MADDGRFLTTRLATIGGLKYKQMEGFPTFEIEDGVAVSVEKYLMLSSDLMSFFAESHPLPYVDEQGYLTLPTRRKMPGTTNMITRNISAEPHTGTLPGDPLAYDSAAPSGTYDAHYVVTIRYEGQILPDVDARDPVTFLERSINAGGEFLSLGSQNTVVGDAQLGQTQFQSKLDTADGEQPTTQAPVPDNIEATADPNLPIIKFVPKTDLTFRWPMVLYPPWTSMFSLLGTVNGEIRDSDGELDEDKTRVHSTLFFGAEPETILFRSFSGSQKFIWNGSSGAAQPWSVDYSFSGRRIEEEQDDKVYGWNHVWIPKNQKWQRVYRSSPGGGRLDLYAARNHLRLFTAGTKADRRYSETSKVT